MWQLVHVALLGMWLLGFVFPVNGGVVVWQPPQSPVSGWAASWAAVGRTTMVTP